MTTAREHRIADLKERIDRHEKNAKRDLVTASNVRNEYHGTLPEVLREVEEEASHFEDLAELHLREADILRAEVAELEGKADRTTTVKCLAGLYFELSRLTGEISSKFAKYASFCERIGYTEGKEEAAYESNRWDKKAATYRETADYYSDKLAALEA